MGKCRENKHKPKRKNEKITVGKIEEFSAGRGIAVKLKKDKEIALFHAEGKFYAVENFCPHKGVPLADSPVFGKIVECDAHGWRFNLKNGECLTKKNCSIETYEVFIEDDWVKILI